jgi:hypothetical protein
LNIKRIGTGGKKRGEEEETGGGMNEYTGKKK